MNIFELFANSNNLNSQNYPNELIGYLFSIQTLMIVVGAVSFVITAIFYIRWWFAQSDISQMSKDLNEIKNYIIKNDDLELTDENNFAESSPTIKEKITLVEKTEKILIKANKIFHSKSPKWLLIVLSSIALILIIAILYMNFFI